MQDAPSRPARRHPTRRPGTRDKRHGERCAATPLPFGLGLYYYPNKTKYKHQHKFQSRLCYGIIVGYGLEGALKFGSYEALKPVAAALLTSLGLSSAQSTSFGPIAAAVVRAASRAVWVLRGVQQLCAHDTESCFHNFYSPNIL